MNTDTQAIEHRIRFLELLVEEYRLKAKRLALQAAYYERLSKERNELMLDIIRDNIQDKE